MTTLIHHLGKECRDHRATLIAIPLVVTALALGAFALVDTYWIQTGFMPQFTCWSVVGVAVLLAPGMSEQDAGTLALLRRLPEGLATAFCGKVLFLLGAMAATGLFVLVMTSALRASTLTGRFDLLAPFFGWGEPAWVLISLATGGALWILAASFWLPRASLSIPLAVIVMVLCLAPTLILFRDRGYLVDRLPFGWALALHPLLALALAWFSVARGRRAGGTAWSSAWRGLCVAGVGCLAVTTSGVATIIGESYITRGDAPILRTVHIGSGGRYAFVTGQLDHRAPTVATVVDLRDGSWRKFGGSLEAGEFFGPDVFGGFCPFPRSTTPLIAYRAEGAEQFTWIDTRTAAVVGRTPLDRPFAGMEQRCRDAVREWRSMLLPDGRRCWFFAGKLEVDRPGGGHVELGWDRSWLPGRMCGFGIQLPGDDGPVYDLIRGRAFAPEPARADFVLVLPGSWLVADERPGGGYHSWRSFDPDSGRHAPVRGMRDGDSLVTLQQDGRLIIRNVTGEAEHRGLFRVDPVGGRRRQLATPGFDVAKVHVHGVWTWAPDPAGCTLSVQGGGRARTGYLHVDADSVRMLPLPCHVWRVGPGTRELFCLHAEYFTCLYRFDPVTGERITVFSVQ